MSDDAILALSGVLILAGIAAIWWIPRHLRKVDADWEAHDAIERARISSLLRARSHG